MSNLPSEAGLPRLLSLAVHEFRNPLTVVAGYIRMLLKDRAGVLTDQQRKLLGEAEKSCTRLSALVAEMSDLSNLEAGTAPFNRSQIDLRALLGDVIAGLPDTHKRHVEVNLATGDGAAMIHGDPKRLRTAFTSILNALGREIVSSTPLVVKERPGDFLGRPASWITFASAEQIQSLEATEPAALRGFDEWRGGCGLSLPVARRIVVGHGGAIWSPSDGPKSAAVVVLPHA
jgi:signal transduction histidine kinase